jgi:hypothetical protein
MNLTSIDQVGIYIECMVFRKRLFEQKWIKLRNKWHSVENTTDDATCLKNSVNYIVA